MNIAIRTIMMPSRWPAFARGMIAYGSAEGITRIVRLAAILVVARQISPEMLGTAALSLSLFELVRVLANVGIGQRIIQANQAELIAICNTASRLFWIVCLGVAVSQLGVAALALLAFGMSDVAAMLAALSAVYLFMPAGLVQIFLAMREQRMGATASVTAIQNIADCILTVVLAVLWPSAWAIVLPKLLTAPLWLLLARGTHAWTPNPLGGFAPISVFASFGPAILCSELLIAARLHGDKLIIGAMLGTEALGLYFLAFNAGLGITQSLVTACNLVLFPHLAKTHGEELETEFRRAFIIGLAALVPLVVAQALLASIYVPIIFGENWIAAAPYLSMLACAAVPLFVGALLSARFRAVGKPYAETALMAVATSAALIGLTVGAQSSLMLACLGFAGGLALVLLPAAAIQFNALRPTQSVPSKGGQ
ncbi:oligosaccharide flippase family protein [Erythrobacter sp. R86502]|uniref:oligosaccharide flippase family protein n=1 Tax=Erythrobacter sp. R86502 TaxID=3093846 RepID=UPI0036D3C310